ncbi:ser-thr-rich glycosyl-phosphatidyl-inositol-anchored membrane family protein, partial [Rhizoctonia solani AG-3 Rhs1AP]
MLSVLFIFLTSIIYVHAFVITQPDSSGWPRNVGLMTVRWNTSPPDPPTFTMLLRDASRSSVVNPLAIAANVPSALGSFELDLPTVPVSQTYQVLFVDPTDLSQILATSSIFPITNSPNATSSETITRSTVTVTLTLPLPSSTTPPTTSLFSSIAPSTSSIISSTTIPLSTLTSETSSSTASTTSTLETAPVTVTITVANPDASFVPINAAGRLRSAHDWFGLFGIVVASFYLGRL